MAETHIQHNPNVTSGRAKPDHIDHMTWFDVLLIDGRGLIAEHWDP